MDVSRLCDQVTHCMLQTVDELSGDTNIPIPPPPPPKKKKKKEKEKEKSRHAQNDMNTGTPTDPCVWYLF